MSGKRKKAKGPFGLSPLSLFAAACLLVLLGASGGVILDVMLRPEPVRRVTASHHVPPPIIHTPEEIATDDERVPSVLAARPAPPAEPRPVVPIIPPPPEKPDVADVPSPQPQMNLAVAKPSPTPLPSVGREKHPATAYAMPSSADEAGPAIAIVIDDMGLDRVHTAEVLELPPGVTVSIMTYANDLDGLAARARAAGHEILAHVPMQPLGKDDPGPHALTVAMDDATVRATLAADLDRWNGYVGINNHMGSRFTLDSERMAAVMAELKSRGLLWLDSRTTNESVGSATAQGAGVPFVARDVFLDNVDTVAAVLKEIEHTVAIAKARGTAIAIGHPHQNTIAALKQALPGLADRGIGLVPVTEILRRQQSRTRPS